jgi:putative ABC transport system permease protein
VWLGGQWFAVAGILRPAALTPEIDTSALVRYTAAQNYLGYVGMAKGQTVAGPPSRV